MYLEEPPLGDSGTTMDFEILDDWILTPAQSFLILFSCQYGLKIK